MVHMVRPVQLTRPRLKRRKMAQIRAIQESGARLVGRTKGGEPLYSNPMRGIYKARDIELGIEREAHFKYGFSKKKAREAVGL